MHGWMGEWMNKFHIDSLGYKLFGRSDVGPKWSLRLQGLQIRRYGFPEKHAFYICSIVRRIVNGQKYYHKCPLKWTRICNKQWMEN